MENDIQNKDSILDFIESKKKFLPAGFYFMKEVEPTFVPYRYSISLKHNSAYIRVGVYRKLISISFLDE